MKTKGETRIPEPFELSAKTLEWIERKYPEQIDVEETVERFEDWAKQNGVIYADWQAGFKSVVRKGMDNGWRSIVTTKKAKAHADLTWQNILSEARKFGFREPKQGEGVAIYRSELEYFKKNAKANVVPFQNVLKRVAT